LPFPRTGCALGRSSHASSQQAKLKPGARRRREHGVLQREPLTPTLPPRQRDARRCLGLLRKPQRPFTQPAEQHSTACIQATPSLKHAAPLLARTTSALGDEDGARVLPPLKEVKEASGNATARSSSAPRLIRDDFRLSRINEPGLRRNHRSRRPSSTGRPSCSYHR
jgi:hypothetical protein